ncbi:hypothetical protein V6Z11_A05G431700 [Gossypium hirsutum]
MMAVTGVVNSSYFGTPTIIFSFSFEWLGFLKNGPCIVRHNHVMKDG